MKGQVQKDPVVSGKVVHAADDGFNWPLIMEIKAQHVPDEHTSLRTESNLNPTRGFQVAPNLCWLCLLCAQVLQNKRSGLKSALALFARKLRQQIGQLFRIC